MRPKRSERPQRPQQRGPQWRWLWGRHAVEEAVRANPEAVQELWVLSGSEGPHIPELVNAARAAGAKVRWASRSELDRATHSAAHQGLAVMTRERAPEGLAGLLAGLSAQERADVVLVALDQIQDPHNLGAIARSAACLGARGLLVPERRSSPVTPAAVQASAGAIEKIPVFTVVNLAQALDSLKEEGFWVYGADMDGAECWGLSFQRPLVLVIGSEGQGMRPSVRERCDEVVRVPQSAGGVSSLNASCAASVLLYEIARGKKS